MTDAILILVAKGILVSLMVVITFSASYVFLRALRVSEADSGPGGFGWQALLFAVVMALFLGAALGLKACYDLVVNGWGALVGVVAALFGGWLTYKARKDTVTVSSDQKGGPVVVSVTPHPDQGPPKEGL